MIQRQRAQKSSSLFLLSGGMRYIPVAGTWAINDGWYSNPGSTFALTLAQLGFQPIRAKDGRPFRWSTDLDGVKFWGRHSQWEAGADAAYYFCEFLPLEDLNFICHSHGAQPILILAAQGFKIRSLTTIGSPVRHDVPSTEALKNIAFWQHIYDDGFDKMGWIGSWFDGKWSSDRTFKHLGEAITRYPLKQIDHSKLLRDDATIALWRSQPWLENIRSLSTPKEAA